VIVRILLGSEPTSTTGSPVVTTSGSYKIYQFNGSGTMVWS
jgi:hypothetical protein